MAEKLIVIGGTAAGLSAASKAKRVNPELEITVFERSGYISYGACGLPYFVGGMIEQPDDLVSLTVEQMRGKRDHRVRAKPDKRDEKPGFKQLRRVIVPKQRAGDHRGLADFNSDVREAFPRPVVEQTDPPGEISDRDKQHKRRDR